MYCDIVKARITFPQLQVCSGLRCNGYGCVQAIDHDTSASALLYTCDTKLLQLSFFNADVLRLPLLQ